MSADLDLTSYLPYLLNRAGSRIAESFSVMLRQQHGITLQMWRVLAALQHRDGQRVGELSGTTSIEVSTLSRLLNTMEDHDLVERRRPERSGGDARIVTICLTGKGRETTSRIIPVARDYEAIALAGLSDAETAELKRLLGRVFENMADLDKDERKLAS